MADKYALFAPIFIVGGLFSILGGLAVAFIFALTPSIQRDHASRLILFITLSDIAFALKYFLSAIVWEAGGHGNRDSFGFINDGCLSAAAWGQFFAMASTAWNACWIFDFLCILQYPLRNTASNRPFYHAFVWTSSIVTTAIIIGLGTQSKSDDFTCWLRGDTTEQLAFIIPLYAFMFLGIVSLIVAFIRLRRGSKATSDLRSQLLSRHAIYIFAFLFIWLWPILHHLFDAQDSVFFLSLLDVVVISSQGFLFSLVRLSEPGAWRLLKMYCFRFWNAFIGCITCNYRKLVDEEYSSVGNDTAPFTKNDKTQLVGGYGSNFNSNPSLLSADKRSTSYIPASSMSVDENGRSGYSFKAKNTFNSTMSGHERSAAQLQMLESKALISSSGSKYINPLLTVAAMDKDMTIPQLSLGMLGNITTPKTSPQNDRWKSSTPKNDAERSNVTISVTTLPSKPSDLMLDSIQKEKGLNSSRTSRGKKNQVNSSSNLTMDATSPIDIKSVAKSTIIHIKPSRTASAHESLTITNAPDDGTEAFVTSATALQQLLIAGSPGNSPLERRRERSPLRRHASASGLSRVLDDDNDKNKVYQASGRVHGSIKRDENNLLDEPLLKNENPSAMHTVESNDTYVKFARMSEASENTSDSDDNDDSIKHTTQITTSNISTNKRDNVVSDTQSEGKGWDVGYTLRMEETVSMLSGLCQAVLCSDAYQEARERNSMEIMSSTSNSISENFSSSVSSANNSSASQIDTPSDSSSSNIGLFGRSAAGLTPDPSAPASGRLDVSALCRDPSSRVSYFSLVEAIDVNDYYAGVLKKAMSSEKPVQENYQNVSSINVSSASISENTDDTLISNSLSKDNESSGVSPLNPTSSLKSAPSFMKIGSVAMQFNKNRPASSRNVLSETNNPPNGSFELVSFADAGFAQLRAAANLRAPQIVYALDPCLLRSGVLKAHFSDGASTAFFCRSIDQLLIVKTISEAELKELLRLLPAYTRFMLENPASLLCRFYGLFSIRLPSSSRVFFTLMGNVFPIVEPGPRVEIFDLKGSTHGRRARTSKAVTSREGGGGTILQDLEFRERYPHGLPGCDTTADEEAVPSLPVNLPLQTSSNQEQNKVNTEKGTRKNMDDGTESAPVVTIWPPDLMFGLDRSQAIVNQLTKDAALLACHGLMDYSLLVSITPIDDFQSFAVNLNPKEPSTKSYILRPALSSGGDGCEWLPLPYGNTLIGSTSMSSVLSELGINDLYGWDEPTQSNITMSEQGKDLSSSSMMSDSVICRLSLNGNPKLTFSESATLIRAAATLPVRIADFGARTRNAGISIDENRNMSEDVDSQSQSLSYIREKLTRWSPLSVSLCALGIGGISPSQAAAQAAAALQAASNTTTTSSNGLSSSLPTASSTSNFKDTLSPNNSVANMRMASSLHLTTPIIPPPTLDIPDADNNVDNDNHPSSPLSSSVTSSSLQSNSLASPTSAAAAYAASLRATVSKSSGYPSDSILRLPHTYRRRALIQIGIVDVLQAYDVGKRVENAFKSMRYTLGNATLNSPDISSVDPAAYALRFTAFVSQIFTPSPSGFTPDTPCQSLPSLQVNQGNM